MATIAKIKAALIGKKTYILAGLTILGVWLDYFVGLGLSDLCQAAGEPCKITLEQAIGATIGAAGFASMRGAIASSTK